jgi:hypothetical protein
MGCSALPAEISLLVISPDEQVKIKIAGLLRTELQLQKAWPQLYGGIYPAAPSRLQGEAMRIQHLPFLLILCLALLMFPVPAATHAQSQVMGALKFNASTKIEKSSGVWIDGKYVGYVTELKGHNKIMLLPGTHSVLVRQAGYTDFTQDVTIQPGVTVELNLKMNKDPEVQYSKTPSEIKLDVMPTEAGVFLDGQFVGYVHQFGGASRLDAAAKVHPVDENDPGHERGRQRSSQERVTDKKPIVYLLTGAIFFSTFTLNKWNLEQIRDLYRN